MGLDMYAFAFHQDDLTNPESKTDLDVKPGRVATRKWYWRKFNHLHGWMHRLYQSKGGQSSEFNCNTVRIENEDLDDLAAIAAEAVAGNTKAFPSTGGFFFGGSELYPEDVESLVSFIAEARAELAQGRVLFYDSWW